MTLPPDSTVLVAHRETELREALQKRGFRVISWPAADLRALENAPAFDEAIANLYGYDWLVFPNPHSARFFLTRLQDRDQHVSELDSLRVCAIGIQTAAVLEHAQIHVDVIPSKFAAAAVITDIATYLGERDSLERVNFLIPQAAIGRDYLKDAIEDAGARADVIVAYHTVADADAAGLLILKTLLQTSSIEAVIFRNDSDIEELARVFDTNDVGKVLRKAQVVSLENNLELAEAFGVSSSTVISNLSAAAVARALVQILE